MSSTQDLGLVTAYGYAVEGGYTGTEAEFKTLLGQQQTYHDEAVQAAEDAEAYAAQAMSGTPDGYASLVSTVNSLNSALADTNSALSIITDRLKFFTVKSTNPFTMTVHTYTSCILLGFAQGIGSVLIGIAVIGGGAAVTTKDLMTGQAFSNAHLTISISNSVLTISSDNASNSTFAILAGGF